MSFPLQPLRPFDHRTCGTRLHLGLGGRDVQLAAGRGAQRGVRSISRCCCPSLGCNVRCHAILYLYICLTVCLLRHCNDWNHHLELTSYSCQFHHRFKFIRSIIRAKLTPEVAETDGGSCDCIKYRMQKHRLSQSHQPRISRVPIASIVGRP